MGKCNEELDKSRKSLGWSVGDRIGGGEGEGYGCVVYRAGEAPWVWWHDNGSGSSCVHGEKGEEMGARVVHAKRVRVVLGHIVKEEEEDSGCCNS